MTKGYREFNALITNNDFSETISYSFFGTSIPQERIDRMYKHNKDIIVIDLSNEYILFSKQFDKIYIERTDLNDLFCFFIEYLILENGLFHFEIEEIAQACEIFATHAFANHIVDSVYDVIMYIQDLEYIFNNIITTLKKNSISMEEVLPYKWYFTPHNDGYTITLNLIS